MNKELQEIQKLIDSDASYDSHYLVHNNKVRLLISTIESQVEQIEEQAKELERLGIKCDSLIDRVQKEEERGNEKMEEADTYYDWWDKTRKENQQLRNQLSELCPIGDFDVITSLKAEKSHMTEQIVELRNQLESQVKINTELQLRNADLAGHNVDIKQQLDKAVEALVKAEKFIDAIMGFYGQNLSVFNWHMNGEGEPWDNFFDENMDGDELDLIREALSHIQGKENEQ